MIIGIDPGAKGGLAVLTDDGGVVFAVGLPSLVGLVDELVNLRDTREKDDPLFCFMEQAKAFPGQGVVSMFNYGTGYGQLIGVLTALRIRYELVPPHVWTKEMLAGSHIPRSSETKTKKDKTRNIEAARRLFPDVDDVRKTKPHEGVVDALLIAEHGRRRRMGGPL